jgi:hypothetical protein
MGSAASGGSSGYFEGDVTLTGKLNVPRFHTTQVINTLGGLPIISATFTTSDGTLLLFYSGSGYAQTPSRLIGMSIKLDGNLIDTTGIFFQQQSGSPGFRAQAVGGDRGCRRSAYYYPRTPQPFHRIGWKRYL